MSTIILFITLIAIIAIFAVFFACYQSQQRARELQAAAAQEHASDERHAAIIFSRPSYPPQGSAQGPYSIPHRVYRKMPTPASIISNLPCVKYDASTMGPGEKDEAPTCVICCCEYEQDDRVKLLPCLHSYHEECIDAWLQRDHCCPICQADVVLAAGLSLHDWSAHTCEAINWLSGSAARNRQRSDVQNDTDQQSGSIASVHQPATPTARSATPAAVAASPASPSAASIVAVQEPGDMELQAVRLMLMPQQQQQHAQPGQQQQQQQQQEILPAGIGTNGSSSSSSISRWRFDGTRVIFQPAWLADSGSDTPAAATRTAHPPAIYSRPSAAAADAPAAAAQTDHLAGSTSSADVASTAALTAPPAAASSARPDHVVVTIPVSTRAGPSVVSGQ